MMLWKRLSVWIVIPILTLIASGCRDASSPDHAANELIRVGKQRVTVAEYSHALEIAKTAYPHNLIQDQSVLKSVQLQVLSQMIEEMVLCSKAAEMGLAVSEAELETAVMSIQQEFPEDTFQKTLLENAIPYPYWEKRLETRLLMEKVLEKGFEPGIDVQPEDMTRYLETCGGGNPSGSKGKIDAETEKAIMERLQRQKAEKAYEKWIERLQQTYPVKINMQRWQEIRDS